MSRRTRTSPHIWRRKRSTRALTIPISCAMWIPSLRVLISEGKKLFKGKCILGGFDNNPDTLIDIGSKEEVEAFAKKLIRESGYKGYVLGADCSIPNGIDAGRIRWISDIANRELKEIELTVKENKGKKYIGILSTEIYKLITNPVVKFNFLSGESGPSGGLAIALTIYNNLVKEDITKGRKIVVTGAIARDGEIKNIGGVEYKLDGAINDKADVFIVPSGENYDTVKKICEKKKCPKLIKAINFKQVVEELKK